MRPRPRTRGGVTSIGIDEDIASGASEQPAQTLRRLGGRVLLQTLQDAMLRDSLCIKRLFGVYIKRMV